MIDLLGDDPFFIRLAHIRRQRLHDQYRMMRRHRAAAFRHKNGVRYFLGITYLFHGIHNRIDVFLKGVIDAVRRCHFTGLVIHTEAAAHIDVLDFQAAFPQGGVNPGDLLHGLFEVLDVENLAPKMKVQQLEIRSTSRCNLVDQLHELRQGDSEFRGVARGLGPLSGSRGRHLHACAKFRTDADFVRL